MSSLIKVAKRFGYVIPVKNPNQMVEYKRLHANVWPEVLKRQKDGNIRNFTLYFSDKLNLLFAHAEYIGNDFDADMKALADDPTMKEWSKLLEPVQEPWEWENGMLSEHGKLGKNGVARGPRIQLEEVFHDGLKATAYKNEA